jgi:hypothetical protein
LSQDSDEPEGRRLLEVVSQHGLKRLTVSELGILYEYVQSKDYSVNKKADKSKKKLLKQINVEMYNKHHPRRLF